MAMSQDVMITIDGPAGTGKSTLASLLAKKIGWRYYNTGALYRALTGWMLAQSWISEHDTQLDDKYCDRLQNLELIVTNDGSSEIYINQTNVTPFVNEQKLALIVSRVSSWKPIRDYLLIIQQQLGQKGECIFEGRDMGSIVFPQAMLKFYIDASPEVRAQRRLKQLQKQSKTNSFSIDEILEQIKQRDFQDQTRKHSPLCIPDDAIIIDTTSLSLDQALEKMMLHFNHKILRLQ